MVERCLALYDYAPAKRTPGLSWLPVTGIGPYSFDFRKVYEQLNHQFNARGIEPIKRTGADRIVFSDLDEKTYHFDPFRVVFDPLGEYADTDEATSAAGNFGLQERFWNRLKQNLTGRFIEPSDALEFSIIPVFKFNEQFFLLISNTDGKAQVRTVNYTGDADAVSRAETKTVKSRNGSFEGKYLELTDGYFKEYLRLRRRIDKIERNSTKKAFEDLLGNPEIEPAFDYVPKEELSKILRSIPHYTQLIRRVSDYKDAPKFDENDRASRLRNYMGVAVFEFLIPFFTKAYDIRLREAQYVETIGLLSDLMTKNYKKMANGF